MATTRPKRHWHQFSLLTLLVVVTLFCVSVGCVAGWVEYRQQRAQENRDRVAAVKDAVAAIEKLGGWVAYEYEELRSPTWLEEQFDDPGNVDHPVAALEVTQVGFWTTKVTDADLEQLSELKSLEVLSLNRSGVTDEGLLHVKWLKRLQLLDLRETTITDAGLEHVKGLTNLQHLNLRNTNVGDAGLKHLAGLSELRWLNLNGTNVTDAGLKHLRGLTNLRSLRLYNTNVTDAGFKHLKSLVNLQELYVPGPNVTDEGVKKLQQALPNCTIYR